MMDLAGKKAIVTGASSGIGHAVARHLAARGVELVIMGRNEGKLIDLGNELPSKTTAVTTDISNAESTAEATAKAWGRLGNVDALVHAAGILTPSSIEEMTVAKWREQIDVNLSGTFHVMRESGLRMKGQGFGSMISIGSDLSFKGAPMYSHYCAAKAGVVGLTRAFALELAPTVRVNCVCPGPVDTPMMESEFQWFGGTQRVREEIVGKIPMKRMGSPDEIAAFIAFVAFQATFATGNILSTDGGNTA
ncbi:SDR family NAD(P)-dependent oxidoreductase [Agrobacterium sp. NPDC089420]|uniref:SDR family NAD(P)-dependent oxidoreductase n=1 Tax=Agrobacterium sp. NPDC089420 TaxID=3363918 RepID=UPI0038515FC8